MRKAVLPVIVLLFMSLPGITYGMEANASTEEIFYQANQAYKQGMFEDAAKAYEQLINAGHVTGDIYYNLGNSYFRMGQTGRAVLMYERAYILIPRDEDLLFNMHYVKDQRVDAVQERQGLVDSTFFWLNSFSLAEFYWVFVILNALLFAVLILRLFMNPSWMSLFLIAVAFIWFTSAGSLALKWYEVNFDNRAVILDKEIHVLAGPGEGDTVLFKLHEGTIVYQQRSEGHWALIELSADKRGWVHDKGIAVIRK